MISVLARGPLSEIMPDGERVCRTEIGSEYLASLCARRAQHSLSGHAKHGAERHQPEHSQDHG
jgi:hypothetical protein